MADTVSGPIGQAVETVNVSNIKTVAEQAAFMTGLAMQNAVAHQNRSNILAEAFLSTAVKMIHEVDPTEAVSTLKMLTGDDMGQKLANLANVVAQIQQSMKGAQTTPPATA